MPSPDQSMMRAFLLGVRLHGRFVRESLRREGRIAAPFGLRRIGALLLIAPVFAALQLCHWIGFALDEWLFPKYRSVNIRQPVFISGIPRSGTTFVHRFLAKHLVDTTTFSTWEAVLAPSICERLLIRALDRLDQLLGGPGRRLLGWITERMAGRQDAFHPIRLEDGEEDYLALLPIGGCFITVLLFPSSPQIWSLTALEEWPAKDRATLLDFYHRCLQRHLWFHGPDKRLLSKNAAFASWLPYLRDRYPDGRFLVCVRPPHEALPSNLSSLRAALLATGNARAAPAFTTAMAKAYLRSFQQLLAFASIQSTLPTVGILDQPVLKAHPEKVLGRLCQEMGLPLEPSSLTQDSASAGTTQPHRHRWFTAAPIPAQFSSQCHPIYEQIKALGHSSSGP